LLKKEVNRKILRRIKRYYITTFKKSIYLAVRQIAIKANSTSINLTYIIFFLSLSHTHTHTCARATFLFLILPWRNLWNNPQKYLTDMSCLINAMVTICFKTFEFYKLFQKWKNLLPYVYSYVEMLREKYVVWNEVGYGVNWYADCT